MKNFGFGLLLMLMLIWAVSCSSGSEPITPGSSISDNPVNELPLMVSDMNADGSAYGGSGVLGVFSVHVDTATLDYDMTGLRTTSSKDGLEVIDVTNFMTGFPCKNCASLTQVGFTSTGEMNMVFGIKHPFPAPKLSDPISGMNRADLHLFNVEGMLVFADDSIRFNGLGVDLTRQVRVSNADGYSSYLDEALDTEVLDTDASIHPYRTFFVNYGNGNFDPSSANGFTSIANPSGYMVCKQGSLMDQKPYFVAFTPGEKLEFLFVVQASWGVSSESRNERLNPVYHCPQFNKKAPSLVEVEILNNDLQSGNATSAAQLRIKVLDINANATVGTGLGEMRAKSNVGSFKVEIPGITTSPLIFNNPTPDGGDPRNPNDPMYFDFELLNAGAAPQDDYIGLVEVIDSYAPDQNTNPILTGYDGAERVPYPDSPVTRLFAIDKFSTYQVFNINVATSFVNQAPVAVFKTIPNSTCGFLPRDIQVTIDASESYDPDFGLPNAGPCGDVVFYEFDFDWDGLEPNFAPGPPQASPIATHVFTQSGPTIIGVRVTDGCLPPLRSDIARLDVTIGNPDVFRGQQTMASFGMQYPVSYPYQGIFDTSPMIAVDNNVYVAWTATDSITSVEYVYVARSNDGGCTWGQYQPIYTKRPITECPLNTIVFVALEKLANGDPIACVISPKSSPCNYQAYFFHGMNIGENDIEWGHADAADLFGANSSFVDLVGHPTDPDLAYLVQWRTDLTPPQLMFVRVKGIISQPDPFFPNILVDLGLSNIVEDIDIAIDQNSKLHCVFDTISQVKYISVDPTPYPPDPPIFSPVVVVSRPADVDPRNARLDVDRNGIPYVVYEAQNPGPDYNIYLQKGVGDPVTFPNASIMVHSTTAGEQMNPDIKLNTLTGDLWIAYQTNNNPGTKYQVVYDRFNSSLTRITPPINEVNTDDRNHLHDDLDPSLIYDAEQNAMMVCFYEGPGSIIEPNIMFNRTN